MFSCDCVRNGDIASAIFRQGNVEHANTGFVVGFANAIRHCASLTNPDTDAAFVIAYHNDCAESEATTTLNNFSDTANIDNAFV
jgi:hypothetical protein